MGKRLEKFQEISELAGQLKLNPANRCKLLLSNYLKRARTRLPFLPVVRLRIAFTFDGRPVTVVIRSNEVDYRLLAGVFARREYEVPVAKPLRILDLGANIGTASVFFHAMHPEAEIVAVEALPGNLPILRENFAVSGIPGRVIGAAISDRPGTATFYLGEADCSSVVRQPWMTGEAIKVECITVPEIMRQANWDGIDFLKVDVEGAEKAVFANCGGWIGKVGALIAELHDGYTIEDFEGDTQGQFACARTFEYGDLKGVVAVRKAVVAQ